MEQAAQAKVVTKARTRDKIRQNICTKVQNMGMKYVGAESREQNR